MDLLKQREKAQAKLAEFNDKYGVSYTLEDYNNIVNLLTQKVRQWAEMDQNK